MFGACVLLSVASEPPDLRAVSTISVQYNKLVGGGRFRGVIDDEEFDLFLGGLEFEA
jgi:hypothetical protein